jgi:prophage regulatory protein
MPKTTTIKPPDALPETGFVRLSQIVPGLIPIGRTAWWAGVKDGRYPQPVKLGPRTTAWRCEDIRGLIQQLGVSA